MINAHAWIVLMILSIFKPARVPSRDSIKNSETNSEAEYIECVATECLAVYQYLLHLLWYARHILCVGISMHTSMGHMVVF